MGKIHEAIAELVRLSNKHTVAVAAVECGDVSYTVDSSRNFRRVTSLKGIKESDGWRIGKKLRIVGLGKDGSESMTIATYQKVHVLGTTSERTAIYPSLVRTSTGAIVQLAV